MVKLQNNKNMKNQNIHTGLLRLGIGLMMLSGANTLFAQEAEQAPAKPARATVALPLYEMKEVSGYVYDETSNPVMLSPTVKNYVTAFTNNNLRINRFKPKLHDIERLLQTSCESGR